MKIVIDIPKIMYGVIKEYGITFLSSYDKKTLRKSIANGTPLPKHHGRLIDADKLRETMEKDPRKALSFVDLTDFVWLAPTIIEAESEAKK